jgi:hypothetical protein
MPITVTVDIATRPSEQDLTSLQEQVLFYYHLGRTFTQWAAIEIALSTLFVACMHREARDAAQAAFFGIDSFYSKLQATGNAVWAKTRKRKWLWEDWAGTDKEIGLKDRISSASGIRNQLAHFMDLKFPAAKSGKRVNLSSNFFNPLNLPMPRAHNPQQGYFVDDFPPLRERFFAVHQATVNFEASIRRRKPPYPEFGIRVPRPKKD